MEAGREFQFLEVIGTNVLANDVVRHFSNLTAQSVLGIGETRATRKERFGGELLTLTHRSTCRIVKGKCRNISSVSEGVEGVGEGRIVNGSFLNCI